MASSTSTGFGPLARGFWGAVLRPNKVLVVTIPEGAHLCLLQAALSADPPTPGAAWTDICSVRCRTPARKDPATLCHLKAADPASAMPPSAAPSFHLNSSPLQLMFTHAKDGKVAIAAEGPRTVHVIGVYSREKPLEVEVGGGLPAGGKGGVDGGGAAVAAKPAAAATAKAAAAEAPAPKPAAKAAATAKPAAAAKSATAGGARESGIQEMTNGLKVVDTTVGRGRVAKSGDKLSVRYSGLTADSKGSWFQVRRAIRLPSTRRNL